MRAALPFSIVLGLAWNLIVQRLTGGKFAQALLPSWLLAGALAGAVAGFHTIRSRIRAGGAERFRDVLATYYLGMVAYWAGFVVIERAILCLRQGGWTDFDLHDHLVMIGWMAAYGTVLYGIVLIPLCFLTRILVWRVYAWDEARRLSGARARP